MMRRLVQTAMRVVLGCALAVLPVAGCLGEPPPRIPDEGEVGWAGSALPDWRAGVPHAMVGAVNLCIDRPGSIEITDVTLEHSEGGLRVDAFATRPVEPPGGGSYPDPETFTETLWELGFTPGEATVDKVCPDWDEEEDLYDDDATSPAGRDGSVGVTIFGIQFSKPTDQTARGAIIKVTYRSKNKTYVYKIGFELILCEREEEIPECQFRGSEYYGW